MSEEQGGTPEGPETPDGLEAPDGLEGRERPDPRGRPDDHDDTGLDLARSIARGLAGTRRAPARRTSRPGRRRPADGDPTSSGAHPDDRDPQLLDSTIGRLIADQGWGTDVRVHGVFTRWDQIVGREVAQHCTPASFDDGRLVVKTDSTAWATQLRLLAPTVVRRLNEELGDGTVRVIDAVGPTAPSWKRGPRSMRDGRGPRDTYG